MEGNITVPINIEDKTVLRRLLVELSSSINGATKLLGLTGNGETTSTTAAISSLGSANFLSEVSELRELQNNIRAYIEGELETLILQNKGDIAVVAEQFGTFYQESLAAAWYGLTVKAGGIISGFTTGSIDTDTTTPGTEGSFFSISADKFSVGRAIEDITDPAELAYVQANGLPYGTMYDAQTQEIIPAFLISWNGSTYDILFNGKVSFTNVTDIPSYLSQATITNALADITTLEETNDGVIESFYQNTAPTSGMSYGDWWVDTDASPLVAYRYEDVDGKSTGTLAWRDNSTSILGAAYISAVNAEATADGKISSYYDTDANKGNYTGDAGDIFFASDTKRHYVWNNGWVFMDPATTINSGTTTINGGKITTGTITANQIAANSITGDHIAASSTITSPSIVGGTITGVTIDATSDITAPIVYGDTFRIKSPTDGNTGYVFAMYSNSNYIHHHSYGSGHLRSRVCNSSTSHVTVVLYWNGHVNIHYDPDENSYVYFQYSTNGSTWVTIDLFQVPYNHTTRVLPYDVDLSILDSASSKYMTFRFSVYNGGGLYSSGYIITSITN